MRTNRVLSPREFRDNCVVLEYPDAAAVFDSFARLPRRGSIEVRCRWERRLELQQALVETGAFAVSMEPLMGFREVQIVGLKGRVGPCFETGRSATYTGAAVAVMDDDHHLIVGTIRVCEKTGGLYTLPPYDGLLTVTDGDSVLLDRLDDDPVSFDCSTFEIDAERLARHSFVASVPGEPVTAAFYPGPFSLLVLRDGTILRRGLCTRIASRLVSDLRDLDGLVIVPPDRAGAAESPVDYTSAFRDSGAGCLLGAAVATAARSASASDEAPAIQLSEQVLEALAGTSDQLRRRLHRLIDEREPYFILTGSDPEDSQGCCPSTQVGEANRLAELGFLSCYRESAAADNCTTTIYAIAGEIGAGESRPEFRINAANRLAAAAALSRTGAGPVPDGRL